MKIGTALTKNATKAMLLGSGESDIEVRLFAKPEAFVARRMGVALAVSDNVSDARGKAVKAASLVIVQESTKG